MKSTQPNSDDSPNRDERRGRLEVFYSNWANYFTARPLTSRGFRNKKDVLCYRNCVLTALLHQPLFVNWLLLHIQEKGDSSQNEECLACLLGHLVDEYWSSGSSESLEEFLLDFWDACSQFWDTRSEDQQDCVEFLTKLISQISNVYTGDIQHIFQSVFKYRSTCQNCQNTKYSERDHSWVLGASPLKKQRGSIEDCIQEYMKPEEISGYHCGNCNTKSTLHRHMFIRDAPEVLMVQVTRFKISESGKSSKVKTKVGFAEDLDLTQQLIPRAGRSGETLRYQLTSVIVHLGTTIREGHYISYVKGPRGSWTCLDDESSNVVNINHVLNCHDSTTVPYVLVYNRRPLFTGPLGESNILPDAAGPYSIAEGVGPSPPAKVEEMASSMHETSAHITIQNPQAQQCEEAALGTPGVSDGLSYLFEDPDSPSDGSSSPSLGARWEGQPAEIAVQVTMGDMVLTGVLKGILHKGPTHLDFGSHRGAVGTRSTGIVKSSHLAQRANQVKKRRLQSKHDVGSEITQ
ncbi:putative ubiquitinyl hydrolase 1 [Microsporum ferrugineum]